MLRAAHMLAAYDVPDLVRDHVAAFGGVDAVCYLADLQQSRAGAVPGSERAWRR